MASMILRIIRALVGTLIPRASSTARTELTACTVVQTPQMRCVRVQAERGSRPFRISSMPRNMVLLAQASVTFPSLTSTSILKCPSIRVIGSIAIRGIIHLLEKVNIKFHHWFLVQGTLVENARRHQRG